MELLILFTGLCAFVTDQVPSSEDGNILRANLLYTTNPPHVATVVVEDKYLGRHAGRCEVLDRTASKAPDIEVPERTFYRCDLRHGELVTFHPIAEECFNERILEGDLWQTGCLRLQANLTGSPACPNDKNKDDVYWIGKMSKIVQGSGRIKRSIHRAARSSPNLVFGQVIVPDGTLSIVDFARDTTDLQRPILKVRFASPGLDHEQAVADLIGVTKQVDRDPSIRFWSKEDGVWTYDAVELQKPGDGSRIVAEVKNLPERSLCRDDPDRGEYHYRYLFSALATERPFLGVADRNTCPPSAVPAVPTEVFERLCYLLPRFNDPQCPGALFAPSE